MSSDIQTSPPSGGHAPGMAEAARLCQAVAELRPIPQQPVIIAGPSGVGKTRLLNTTAKALRNRPGNLLLACVSPLHFPDDAAALATDPRPLRRADHAVLLIDGLERFSRNETRLEGLMRQFMNHGGHVVLTSRVHPWGLTNIQENVRLLLARGQVIDVCVVPRGAAGASPGVSRRALDDLTTAARTQASVAMLACNRLRHATDTHQRMMERAATLFEKASTESKADSDRLEGARLRLFEARGLLEELLERPETPAPAATRLIQQALAHIHRVLPALDANLRRAGERDRLLQVLQRVQQRQQKEMGNLMEHRRAAAAEAAGLAALTGWLESALARAEAECAALTAALDRARTDGEKRIRVRGGAKALAARVLRLQEEQQMTADQTQRLRAQLTQRQDAVLRARWELEALAGHNESLSAELDAYRDLIASLETRVAAQGQEIARLRERRAEAGAEADRAEAVARVLEARLEKAREEQEAMSAHLRIALGDRAALVRQLARMKLERDRDRAARIQAESALREVAKPLARHGGATAPIGLDTPALRGGQPPGGAEIVSLDAERRKKRLGELLCENGRITREQLDEALRQQTGDIPKRLGAILVDRGYVDEVTIVEAVASQLGVLFLRLDRTKIIPDTARLVDAADARRHQYIPLSRHGAELTIAMADPLNRDAIAMIEEATKLKVRVVAAPPADIARAQETCYAA